MSTNNPNSNDPWLVYLDEEFIDSSEDTIDLNRILKDFLLSTSQTAAADAARDIDGYSATFLTADPLMKYNQGSVMTNFLSGLYTLVLDIGRLVPYNDPKQDRLVQLIIELRKLPPKPVKIWDEDSLIYTKEPVFVMLAGDNWNGNHASEAQLINGPEVFQEICDQWVNYSSFLARCLEAGLNDNYDNRCKYPDFDITEGLEKEVTSKILRDCRVMVAAQYILLAGRTIHEEYIVLPEKDSRRAKWGLEKWKLWGRKFEELSGRYDRDGESELASVTKQAHKKMLSLEETA